MCYFRLSCGCTKYFWNTQLPLTFVYTLLCSLKLKYLRLWWFQTLSYLLISFPFQATISSLQEVLLPFCKPWSMLWHIMVPQYSQSFFLNISTFCLFVCQKQHKGEFIWAPSFRGCSPPRQRWPMAGPWDNWSYIAPTVRKQRKMITGPQMTFSLLFGPGLQCMNATVYT